NGSFGLIVVQADGAIVRVTDKDEGQGRDTAEIARVPDPASYLAIEVRLHVADLDNNGAIDLVLAPVAVVAGKAAKGALIWLGDQRVNPFGVGGEIEIRSGLFVQKQPITGPQVRFGLGEQASAEVIRVIWPNGSVSAEFEAKADQDVRTEQRLKGSCPFLFAY